jgi:hypothetical protein
MEKRAKEFLELSAKLYDTNKSKWKLMFRNFDEDVYNDTIIKVYEQIMKGEDTNGDLNGYWFKSFKNNLLRNKQYCINKSKEQLDSVQDRIVEEDEINLYYSTISSILLDVRKQFDRKTFEVFRMYLLCNMSYEKLDDLTGVDSKERIMRVRKWINGKKDNR